MVLLGLASAYADITTGLLAVAVILLVKWLLTGPKYPPGPWGLPLVGYLPFLDRNRMGECLFKLGKKWGNVFTIRMGSVNMVILNDYEAVKEGLNKESFLGRPEKSPFKLIEGSQSFATEEGEFWREQRNFSLHVLRDLGLGKNAMEKAIQEEIAVILKDTRKHGGKPFMINDILVPSMSNNIASLVFGERLDFDNPKRKRLDEGLRISNENVGPVVFLVFFPEIMKLLDFFRVGWFMRYKKSNLELFDFFTQEIEEHKKTLDPENIRDYIDAFVVEQKKQANNPHTTFTNHTLNGSIGAFFGAGSETVRVTVEFLFLTMAIHPEVQKKVQDEIDEVIGKERSPEWSDAKNMPYTQAAINELHRWRTIAPIGVTRATTEDTTIQGHFVPKGTAVLYNLWAVHNDPEYWKEPSVYDPERFLDNRGQLKKSDHIMPFAIGKRSCPGEGLANVEVFLYFTSFLQNFTITPPEGKTLSLKSTLAIGIQPTPQELCFISRS